MKNFKIIAIFIIFIFLLIALSFLGTQIGLWHLEFFGTKKADIHRKIFDNSKSQVQGTVQVLNDYRLQYKLAESEGHKAALREAILQEYTAFARKDLLPTDLQNFISNL